MIIDGDTHISPFATHAADITYDALLRIMDRAGVDKAITWLRPPYMREIAPANRYVYEATRAHPDRFLGWGWVDPHLGLTSQHDEIRRCVEEYGFFGVKLNGAQNEFYIDDPVQSLPLIETIAASGKMLAFHIGTDAYEATHPYRLGKIARLFPDTPILMIHMGGVGFHDLSNAAIEVIAANPNILGVGSALRHVNVLNALKTLGADRVAFGSDTPFNLMHVEVAAYRALMDGELSAAEQAQVMSGNLARLHGLTADTGA